jgi:hypothetical protein
MKIYPDGRLREAISERVILIGVKAALGVGSSKSGLGSHLSTSIRGMHIAHAQSGVPVAVPPPSPAPNVRCNPREAALTPKHPGSIRQRARDPNIPLGIFWRVVTSIGVGRSCQNHGLKASYGTKNSYTTR